MSNIIGLIEDDSLTLEGQWQSRFLGLLGKRVVVEGVSQSVRGQLLELTLAHVAIEIGSGEIMRFVPEAIRHLDEV